MLATRLVGAAAVSLTAVLAFGRSTAREASAEPALSKNAQQAQTPQVIISIYRVAPGRHLDFLKWQAARDAITKQIGAGDTQWYVHTNGDSWDFVSIGPATTRQQDDRADALARQRGMTTGFAAALEFRQFVATHTDTYAEGPLTAAQLVSMAGRR